MEERWIEITNDEHTGFVPFETWQKIKQLQDGEKEDVCQFNLTIQREGVDGVGSYIREIAYGYGKWREVDKPKENKKNACTCSIQDLMLHGCKCGGK
jgi:DNA phosphorothioation-dependent restriction protein DptG